jgi:hypothetical protein
MTYEHQVMGFDFSMQIKASILVTTKVPPQRSTQFDAIQKIFSIKRAVDSCSISIGDFHRQLPYSSFK